MSFNDILTPGHEYPYNLYVHSITASTGSNSIESETISCGWTGVWAAGITGNVYANRDGNIVSLCIDSVSGTGSAANSIICANGTLGDFAPVSSKVFPYNIRSGSSYATGLLEVYTNGSMAFYADADGGAFANSGINSFAPGSVSYNLVG